MRLSVDCFVRRQYTSNDSTPMAGAGGLKLLPLQSHASPHDWAHSAACLPATAIVFGQQLIMQRVRWGILGTATIAREAVIPGMLKPRCREILEIAAIA